MGVALKSKKKKKKKNLEIWMAQELLRVLAIPPYTHTAEVAGSRQPDTGVRGARGREASCPHVISLPPAELAKRYLQLLRTFAQQRYDSRSPGPGQTVACHRTYIPPILQWNRASVPSPPSLLLLPFFFVSLPFSFSLFHFGR